MFGSTIIDVAIGLIFLFMAVSLAASAITEAIASALKLRQRTLRKGIGALLNDPGYEGLALSLYNHALVNPLASGAATKVSELTSSPAYVPSRNFALALVGALVDQSDRRAQADDDSADDGSDPARAFGDEQAVAAGQPTLADIVAAVPDPQIRQTLATLLAQSRYDYDAFLTAVGTWFDDAMDRLSGWYKRDTQLIGAIAALVVCAVLNADALRIGTALWRTPALIAELKATAVPSAEQAIKTLDGLGLLGWSAGNFADPQKDLGGFVLMVLGWLIVTGASVFGAPFWFDTLQRIVQLSGTGPDGTGRTGAASPPGAPPTAVTLSLARDPAPR